ncbi:MAG TPA: hypothetical protein VHU21_11830 [Paraburkholderia sp.]|nr:hypothetical protein [Paraburkholderia sp.]
MTSTPLTLIEGALALPRLRPLDHLPEPFGRDWALLPLAQHWRTGLDSLYAALLRTVCMKNQQLRSYGQSVSIYGVPVGVQWTAAPLAEAAARPAGEAANAVAGARPDAPRQAPPGPMRIALKARSPRTAQRRTVWNGRTVAASAGAIVCVAVLAWWVADQPLAPRHIASELLKSAQALIVRRDVPVEKRRYQVARPEAPVIAEAVTPTPVLPPLPADVAAAAPAPLPSEAVHSSRPRRVLRAETHRQPVDRHVASESLHEAHVPRVAVMRARSNTSSANDASFVPAQFGADEYADVMTSAAMPLRDVATPPRTAPLNNLPANSTEWMNHMTQRRVTEIPEQFGR